MTKHGVLLLISLFAFIGIGFCQDDFLNIECTVSPRQILQGNEGVLKIKIIVRNGVKISANPEFLIRLDQDESLSFAKIFFTGSELNLPTTQEKEGIFLDPQKEIEVPFELNDMARIGNLTISGDVIFTMLFQDKWSVKTSQKFSVNFVSRRNYKLKKK
jgi:hypothetical protein